MNVSSAASAIPITIDDKQLMVEQEDPRVAERKRKKQTASANARKRKKEEDEKQAKELRELKKQLCLGGLERGNSSFPSSKPSQIALNNPQKVVQTLPSLNQHVVREPEVPPFCCQSRQSCASQSLPVPANNLTPCQTIGYKTKDINAHLLPNSISAHPIVREVVGHLRMPTTPATQPFPLANRNLGNQQGQKQCEEYSDARVITWAVATIKKLRTSLFARSAPMVTYQCLADEQTFNMLMTVVKCFLCDNVHGCRMKDSTLKIAPTVMRIAMDSRYNVEDPALTGILTNALEKAQPCSCEEAQRQCDEYKDKLDKSQDWIRQILDIFIDPSQKEELQNEMPPQISTGNPPVTPHSMSGQLHGLQYGSPDNFM